MNPRLKKELREPQAEHGTKDLLKEFNIPYRVKYGSNIEETMLEFPILKKILHPGEKTNRVFEKEIVTYQNFITAFMINVVLDKLLVEEKK